MNRFKILIEYDGFGYVGWQRQDNGNSIQGQIEKAIFKLSGENITLHGAGRTDAGVHAKGQVAHFELKKIFNEKNIRDGLNQHLKPQSIVILEAILVSENFHSRFSATQRIYEYCIINRRAPLTFEKNQYWGVFKELNIDKMILESKYFIGKNSLESFRSADCQSKTSIKTIDDIKIFQKGININIVVSAKSFLHSQVRIMVGTLVEIGKGKIKLSVKEIIKNENRSCAGVTAPPWGLYLKEIKF